jgi:hypothetical protein
MMLNRVTVPRPFRLRVAGKGPEYAGFAGVDVQETGVFTPDWSPRAFNESLRISIAARADAQSARLAGTGGRDGTVVKEFGEGVSAEYHDGMWVPSYRDGGTLSADVITVADGIRLYWDRTIAHSVTVTTDSRSYGIQASKNYVGFDDLLRIARSLLSLSNRR